MNDCIWCFLFCECGERCGKYLSVNSKEGFAIMEEYEADVNPIIEEAIKPIVDKYRKKFEEFGEVD